MPVLIDSVNFTVGSVTTSFYKSNNGDPIRADMIIRSLLRVTSVSNPLTLDPITGQVQSPSISWLEEGFRVGDNVLVEKFTSAGISLVSWYTVVEYVDDIMCDFTVMPFFYDIGNGEILTFTVVQAAGFPIPEERDEVDILLNQVKNSTAGTPNSLIDGEVTRVRISNITSLAVGSTINGTILGNQSGNFLIAARFTKLAPTDDFFKYRIRLNFVNSGMYDNGTWFFSAECIKAYISTQWARVSAEPFGRYIALYNLSGDTGYYDEPFNTGVIDSTLIAGVSEIDYCTPTTFDITVDGPTTGVMIGSAYLPTDDTYYKNKLQSQNSLTMIVPSVDVVSGNTYSSYLNPFGAGYTLFINSVSVSGSQTTINVTMTPDAAFTSFMDARDPLDRRFQLWVKCGSINHLVYDDQLVCDPVPAEPLIMVSTVAFLDHSFNVSEYTGALTDTVYNTEDDFGYFGTFLLTKNNVYDRFSVYVEASNPITGEDFSLRVIQFNFDGVQISGDGRYLLNQSISVNPDLPNTSEKITSILKLYPSIDTLTEYGVSIYAPFILNWRYWLPQNNASTDFWPNQNQNWQQYENLDWNVQLRLELVDSLGGHNHVEDIKVLPYDSEPAIDQQIELYLDSNSQNVPAVINGMLHRVVATHTIVDGRIWDPLNIWGMITVEPIESQPRWICSTVVDYDNNTNNPLYPLSTLLMEITYPAPNVARMECYFNPDLIDTSNGVKFTTKIKGCPNEGFLTQKITTNNEGKETTDGESKQIS
jgi:hypothetical protein